MMRRIWKHLRPRNRGEAALYVATFFIILWILTQ